MFKFDMDDGYVENFLNCSCQVRILAGDRGLTRHVSCFTPSSLLRTCHIQCDKKNRDAALMYRGEGGGGTQLGVMKQHSGTFFLQFPLNFLLRRLCMRKSVVVQNYCLKCSIQTKVKNKKYNILGGKAFNIHDPQDPNIFHQSLLSHNLTDCRFICQG